VSPDGAGYEPVLWAGGGSSAYDRHKFLQLGGFDALYEPFYVEDLDLSYRAWKQGWRSLFARESVVYHEHRGTSRPRFGDKFIQNTVRRNELLFAWRNVTDPFLFREHATYLAETIARTAVLDGAAPTARALLRALRWLPLAMLKRLQDPKPIVHDEEIVTLSSGMNSDGAGAAVIDFDFGPFQDQLGPGWYELERDGGRQSRWIAGSAEARLCSESTTSTLNIDAWVPDVSGRARPRSMSIRLDGREIWRERLQPGQVTIRCLTTTTPGNHHVQIKVRDPYVPARTKQSSDQRELSVRISRVGLE
jgi:hypothetical protein